MPKHRLVTLGDSLTQGFQSLAIYNTDLSWPALVAGKMGLGPAEFRRPSYRPPHPPDYMGPPLNLEFIARAAGEADCTDRSPLEQVELGIKAFALLVRLHLYWDAADRIDELDLPAADAATDPPIMHNLAVAGFDVRDLFARTADTDRALLHRWAQLTDFSAIATNARGLISLPVLKTARRGRRYLTPVAAAQALGDEGGIETLVVFVGANNALGTVISLEVHETGPGYDSLASKGRYNLWKPEHFRSELALLVAEVAKVDAEHVLWGNVPHVTTAPLAHGIGGRMASNPELFNFYTYPWIPEDRFQAALDPHLTGGQVELIDRYVDQYNAAIAAAVDEARAAGRDWRLVDVCGLIDRFAYRRFWDPAEPAAAAARDRLSLAAGTTYEDVLPPVLRTLTAGGRLTPSPGDPALPPDSRFFSSASGRRQQGGLVALDGVHPTTIGYGILAEAFLKVMAEAGVDVGDGRINFEELVAEDTLVSRPPDCVAPALKGLGWGEVGFDWVNGFARTFNRPKRAPLPFLRSQKTQ